MSEPTSLPGPVRTFLDQSPESALLVTGSADVAPGRWDRVAVSARDRADLRSTTVPEGVRSAVRVAATWEGFRPSRLVEHDDAELP